MSTLGRCLRSLGITAGLLLCANIATSPASADTIVYHFTGDVTQIQNLVEPLFGNDPSAISMAGSMAVNTTDTTPLDTTTGTYAVTNFSVTINGHTYMNAGPFSGVEILNGLPGQDQFNLTVPPPISGDGVPAPPLALTPNDFFIHLHAQGDTGPFSNDYLPPTLTPSLSSFTLKNEWRLNFAPGGHQVSGSITSLTAVPLPPAVLLFGAGLVALIGLGARNWQRKTVGGMRLESE